MRILMYLLQTVGHRYYVEIADNEKKLGLVLIGTTETENLDALRVNLKNMVILSFRVKKWICYKWALLFLG